MNAFITSLMLMVSDRLDRKDRGATMVEYGLMVALVAIVCVGVVTTLGTSLKTEFTSIAGSL